MDFFNDVGKLALGSRLRMLSEQLTEDAKGIYAMYGVDLKPKWFPVFYVLSQGEGKAITEIADEIGHSHPSVSNIVREMSKFGMVKEQKDQADKRRNVISLSEKGRGIIEKIQPQYQDVNAAIEELLSHTRHNIWTAIEELEYLLQQSSLMQRVRAAKKARLAEQIEIVPYSAKYQQAFRDLNEEWISKYFTMEAADYKALENPETSIIEPGGAILVALFNKEPVGVVALIKMDDPNYDYELAKMAVSPKVQGNGIAWKLSQALIEEASALGAKNLYLESNTIMEAAINLYRKLGFKKVFGHETPYERCNIQMALEISG